MAQRWSPTAEMFAQHQFSHVLNFWKLGLCADFHLQADGSGIAELKLNFKLPSPSVPIPPPNLPPSCAPFTPLPSGLKKASSSRERRREKRAAERTATETATAAEEATAENATAETAEKTGAEEVTDVKLTAEKGYGDAVEVATTSQMSTAGPLPALLPSIPSVTPVSKELAPLPLCHYCCHRGTADHPVHYFQQCMCDDSDCTCLCYCTGTQLEHKHRVFPSAFWGKTSIDPGKVPEAKAIADERTERLRGYSPFCSSDSCVRYMKEDGLCLT